MPNERRPFIEAADMTLVRVYEGDRQVASHIVEMVQSAPCTTVEELRDLMKQIDMYVGTVPLPPEWQQKVAQGFVKDDAYRQVIQQVQIPYEPMPFTCEFRRTKEGYEFGISVRDPHVDTIGILLNPIAHEDTA